jgi:hypothetical protein
MATSGRRDDGNYDEGEPSKEGGKVEYGYELNKIAKCKGANYKVEGERR